MDKGFYRGEEINCEKFQEWFAQWRHGLVHEDTSYKMDQHQEHCLSCRLWVAEEGVRLFE